LVRERLLALIERQPLLESRDGRSGSRIRERARAGEALGWLGDPRPGVGILKVSIGLRTSPLPQFGWCGPGGEVRGAPDVNKAFPVGPFQMGGETAACGSSFLRFKCTRIKKRFLISKYLVTVAQYRCFVDAGGYGKRDKPKPPWWTQAGWEWRRRNNVIGPADYGYVVCQREGCERSLFLGRVPMWLGG
jgi:hypothetical protein